MFQLIQRGDDEGNFHEHLILANLARPPRALFHLAEWLGRAIAHHGPRGSLDFGPLHASAGVYTTDNGEFKLGLSVVPYEFMLSPLSGIHLDLGWFKLSIEASIN